MVVTVWSWKNPQVSRKLIIGNISIQRLSFIHSFKYCNVWLCMGPFLRLKNLVRDVTVMSVVALVYAMCSGSSLACLCDSPIITLSFMPVSQYTSKHLSSATAICHQMLHCLRLQHILTDLLWSPRDGPVWKGLVKDKLTAEWSQKNTLKYKVCGKRQWTGAFEAVSQRSPFTRGRADISVRRWHRKYFWSHVQNLQKERKI